MNRTILAVVVVLSVLPACCAMGQLNIIDQTRTLTASLTSFTSSQVTVLSSDEDILPGNYNNQISGFVPGSVLGFSVFANGTASQTSNVSDSVITAQGAASCTANTVFDVNDGLSGDSNLSMDFSVAAPIPLTLTAQYSADSRAHEGTPAILSDTLTLTENDGSSQTQLFTAGFGQTHDGGESHDFGASGQDTFDTTLLPGLTYNLTMDIYTNITLDGTNLAVPSDSLSFVASVPEPANIATMLAAASVLLPRRRR